MNAQQREFMRGWTFAAKLSKIYSEAECQLLCSYLPAEVDTPEGWVGFTSAMLSGYHEEAHA